MALQDVLRYAMALHDLALTDVEPQLMRHSACSHFQVTRPRSQPLVAAVRPLPPSGGRQRQPAATSRKCGCAMGASLVHALAHRRGFVGAHRKRGGDESKRGSIGDPLESARIRRNLAPPTQIHLDLSPCRSAQTGQDSPKPVKLLSPPFMSPRLQQLN